jgi:hypothetical protein
MKLINKITLISIVLLFVLIKVKSQGPLVIVSKFSLDTFGMNYKAEDHSIGKFILKKTHDLYNETEVKNDERKNHFAYIEDWMGVKEVMYFSIDRKKYVKIAGLNASIDNPLCKYSTLRKHNLFYIEVGYSNKFVPCPKNPNYIKKINATENGIYLGMTLQEFSEKRRGLVFSDCIKAKEYKILKYTNLQYLDSCKKNYFQFGDFSWQANYEKPVFSILSNEYPVPYNAKYIFKNDVLVQFSFGYLRKDFFPDFYNILF